MTQTASLSGLGRSLATVTHGETEPEREKGVDDRQGFVRTVGAPQRTGLLRVCSNQSGNQEQLFSKRSRTHSLKKQVCFNCTKAHNEGTKFSNIAEHLPSMTIKYETIRTFNLTLKLGQLLVESSHL